MTGTSGVACHGLPAAPRPGLAARPVLAGPSPYDDPMIGNPARAADEPDPPPAGLECPDCGCRDLRVDYTRRGPGFITRRRRCRNCGRCIITREFTARDAGENAR